MASSSLVGRSISLFVYLLVLDGAAIFFFTRGFLLTRTELSLFSNCSDISHCPSDCFQRHPPLNNTKQKVTKVSHPGDIHERRQLEGRQDDGELEESGARDGGEKCWTRPAIKKAIILIIDALRFDFVAHSRNFDGERKPWMDKLHVLQRIVEETNATARMFKFVADPPTTTLQRLKGLTTGGLPTFIDIGHSFGAPAVVEDNLILQLARTGKKVIMMGDDTWMQLFPIHFSEAYPFPSFNVKDLHTVDDGVIGELFPALHRDNWDVLIAHFLGVDHVGHIFGVESPLMLEKLEQYNKVIEDVVELLRNMSQPGGLFEDTLLIVMGDHGQTVNGDHGGGTPEEVESALFALGTHSLSRSLLPNTLASLCDLEDPVSGCISTFSQLDFTATLAAALGVPFPFGSVGQVNADLFTLVAGNSDSLRERSHEKEEALLSALELMGRYHEVLCINSWQVRRYFEVYAISAITGFPPQDLARLEDLYTKAQNISDQHEDLDHILRSVEGIQAREEVTLRAIAAVREHVNAHGEYLSAAASLARTQWTQFGLEWMVVGFLLLIACVAIRALALYRLCHSGSKGFEELFPSKVVLLGSLSSACLAAMVVIMHPILAKTSFHAMLAYVNENLGMVSLGVLVAASVVAYCTPSHLLSAEKVINKSDDAQEEDEDSRRGYVGQRDGMDMRTIGALFFVALHAFSLFSNSYIVAEGLVIHFLIASSGLLYLRSAIQAKSKHFQALCFLALIWVMPRIHTLTIFKGVIAGESQGVRKDLVSSSLLQIMLTITTIIVPLGILSWLLNQKSKIYSLWREVTLGVTITYSLIGLHWLMADLETSKLLWIPDALIQVTRLHIPRLIYAITVLLTLSSGMLGKFCTKRVDDDANYRELVVTVGISVLAGSSGTIILLMGRKGPLLMLLAILEVWVFLDLQSVTTSRQRMMFRGDNNLEHAEETHIGSLFGATADWSLIATQLYFCTGHSCAFDGLHYSAAFIGFDDFGFYQQGVLLATETFGASHVFPVIGLPLLVLGGLGPRSAVQVWDEMPIIQEITKSYLWFGLLQAFVASITTASVCIQRRHLMVWGIFAPKYVFDALGFLLVDVLIILAALVYFCLQRKKLHKA